MLTLKLRPLLRPLLLLLLGWLPAVPLQAQYNLTPTYFNHNDLNASMLTPGNLHLGERSFQMAGHYNFWMGNSAVDYGLVRQVFTGEELSQQEVDEYVGDLNSGTNILGMGITAMPLALAVQIPSQDGTRKYTVSLSVQDQLGVTAVYPKALMQLMWRGNKQFAGETVNFDPVAFNASWTREYALGVAGPIYGRRGKDAFALRGGLRLKFVQGIGAVYTDENDLAMTTEQEGRYVELATDYRLNTAGVLDGYEGFNAFAMNGTGFGADLGLTGYLGEQWEFSANVLDLGAVNYDGDLRNFANEGSFRYEGLAFGGLFGDDRLEEAADSVLYIFEPEENEQSYTMPLGAQLLLQGTYKMMATDAQGERFARNAFFLTYVQGFRNLPGVTKRPFVSLGYDHNFGNIFDLGATLGYGGYNRTVVGSFMNLTVGPLRLGIGSENLLPLLFPDLGTGIDATGHASLTF
jgi:hypothetical protein